MNIYSLLSFIVFILYFGMGVYILAQDPRSNVNRSFFYFAFSIAFWSYAYIFLFNTTDKEAVFYWDKIGSIGWCMFPALIFSFYSILTLKSRKFKNIFISAYHVLGIILIYKSFTSKLLTTDWFFNGYTWIPLEENTTSIWYWIFNFYFISAMLSSIVMIFLWRRKEKSKRVKRQAAISLYTLAFSLIGGYTTNFIIPLFKITEIPNIAHIISLIWIAGIAYSIVKYQLMTLSPKVAANTIIQEMKELLFFTDSKGSIISLNRYTEDKLDYHNNELIGKNIIEIFVESDKAGEIADINSNENTLKDFEIHLIPKTGTPFPVKLSVSAITDNLGEFIGNVIVGRDARQKKLLEQEIIDRKLAQSNLKKAHDELEEKVKQRTYDLTFANEALQFEISEHKKAKADLIKAKQKAEESDKLKTSFLANMSHEIRTPLNGMLGFAELLIDDTTSQKERLEYIEIIKSCGEHLLDLINDIIDISKIEVGQLVINKTMFNLNIFLNAIYISFEPIIKSKINKNILLQLNIDTDKDNLFIISDEMRLRQIFINLIGNAIKFTESGSVNFGYTIDGANQIIFFVKDTGIGIPKDKISMIFDRFIQIDNSSTKKYGGTGLGLTITHELIELMQGKIWVESTPYKGSTFYFTIPVSN